MLTSSANQYLRPEYLTPLPTTLDAKKSPLALLAQTCSQIGADTPNSKLLASSEKNNKSHKNDNSSSRDKCSPTSSASNNSVSDMSMKSSFRPYDLNVRDKSRSPEERNHSSASANSRVKTPKSNSATPLTNGRCASNQSATSPRASPATLGRKTPASASPPNADTPVSQELKSTNSDLPSSSSSTVPVSYSSPLSTSKTTLTSDPAYKDIPLGTYKPGIPVTSSYLYSSGLPLPMDLMASSLMAQHHALKTASVLNPYLEYARLKSQNGLVPPVCRDPYCTGCSLSSHLLATSSPNGKTPGSSGSCPAGCVQCDHVSKPSPGYLSGHSPAAAAYAHAQLAALAAASQLPYVCNWIAGDANYCGKRFSSSEELLQHLRTHTSMSESSAALSMLTPPSLPPTHPLFHRTYPTPPLSPLATARYHPYSKPSLLPPSLTPSSLTGFQLPPHPGLPPYFSPYSLYGPRLGAP